MTEPHVIVTATVTNPDRKVEQVFAGTQPAWAWDVDRCEAWREVIRDIILSDRTSDPRGWRVTFAAVLEEHA